MGITSLVPKSSKPVVLMSRTHLVFIRTPLVPMSRIPLDPMSRTHFSLHEQKTSSPPD